MSYFNERMSSAEALKVLYSVVEGKTKEEKERIMAEYKAVLPSIIKQELEGPPAMTSYQF